MTVPPAREEGGAPVAERSTIEEAVADVLERASAAGRTPGHLLRELAQVDRSIYETVARQDTPHLDAPLRRLSDLANGAVLWLGIAGLLWTLGGRTGRRAAAHGLIAVAATSSVVNLVLKSLSARARPDRAALSLPDGRQVRMPTSSSFPSGHSASGFAFASAVSAEVPILSLPLRLLAGAVAYSRVHTGVHFPGDTVAGALIGAATGQMVARLLRR